FVLLEMGGKVDRPQVANGDFSVAGVKRDLGAKVGTVYDADVLLWRTDVAWIFERQPGVAGFEQHGQHLAPQRYSRDGLEQRYFAADRLGLVCGVGFFEFDAVLVVQV